MTTVERKQLRSPTGCPSCGVGVQELAQLSSFDDDNWVCPNCLVEMLDGQNVDIAYQQHEEVMSTDPEE